MSRQDPKRLIQARINGGVPFTDGLASGRELEELVEGVLWGNKIADETTATVEGIQTEVSRLEGLIVEGQGTVVSVGGMPQLTWDADTKQDILMAKRATKTINNVAMNDLQATINSLPRFLDGDVTIRVLAGNYNSTITINDFTGIGVLQIDAIGMAPNTYNHNATNFVINGCNNRRINLQGFTATNTTGNSFYVHGCNTSFIYIYQCNGNGGINTDATNIGLNVNENGTGVYASGCNFSNKGRAFRTGDTPHLSVLSPAGSGNGVIYQADNGGQIRIRSTGVITGTTKIGRTAAGLVIEPNGLDASQIIGLPNLNITEGTISPAAGFSATINNVKRQGNFIVGRLTGSPTATGITIIGNIPEPFRPKSTIDIGIIGYGLTITLTAAAIRGSVMTNGDIVMAGATTTLALDAQFGYEITEG